MGLIQQGAGHRHLRICEHRIPARLLGLKPLAHTVAIGLPGGVRDVVHKAPQPLAQCKHASLNFAEFVDGRNWPLSRGWRCYETLLFARNWLANKAEGHSVSASMYALQTAIN